MDTTIAAITGKQAGFPSLADAWADTTTTHGAFDADRARAGWRSSSGNWSAPAPVKAG